MPESFTKGQPIAQLRASKLNCFAPAASSSRNTASRGKKSARSFRTLGEVADEMCIIRSMHTEAINHDPAHTFMNTGTTISGRPSMGSWLLYGLGSECEDLPGFVVMTSTGKYGQEQPIAARQWHSGFLPSRFQGVEFRSQGRRRCCMSAVPPGVDAQRQRDVVEATEALNRLHERGGRRSGNRHAHRAIRDGVQHADQRAGADGHVATSRHMCWSCTARKGADGSFAANCLLARRLAERGVRFIQLYHRDWDHHGGVKHEHRRASPAKSIRRLRR